VQEIDGVLGVGGVDAVFIGPMDLSGSAGVLRQTSHPVVAAAIEKVLERCKAKNMPVCAGMSAPARAREYGACLVLTGDDAELLRTNALRTLQSYRAEFEMTVKKT
jgi:2-keto-3-deoxy-L-rhamnonate aldolase RhmA